MLTKEEIIKESQKIAIEKGKEGRSRGDVFEGARDGATWANEQCAKKAIEAVLASNRVYERNAARIAELEAMLSKSAFDLDGHIILLQAANQQIEKERKKIAELEAQKAELIAALNTVVSGYETDGMEGMDVRDMVFYKTCKAAIKAS